MGQKFQYDESGSTFFHFLLSFFALVLIPATYYFWPREKRRDPEEEKRKCTCPSCMIKREFQKRAKPFEGPKNFIIKLILVLGWVVTCFLAYKVSQFDYEMANFDPYDILGVSVGASEAEIKKAYRRLSLILHPDKETGNEKEFMKLSKAYTALTNEEARKNWEIYGNPDGPGVTNFGIALPSFIVEKENSVWVLGLYALVFMVALPTAVGTWWYRSIKYTGDQVLLDTTQVYYYLFHKTPNMPLKRVIMILAASFEFNKRFNSEIVERETDNEEVPQLIKKLQNLSEKNKEPVLSQLYSIKTRAIIHAHLSRIPLNPNTLELDRQCIIAKCPYLIQEQVNCVNQLILLVYSGNLNPSALPPISTIENCMKLSPMIVQAMWDTKSPLLQLPYINEDNLKYFLSKKKPIKTLHQYAQLKGEERRALLRSLSEQEYDNVNKVLGNMPYIDFDVNYEVMDDENPTEVTAGAIVTVIVTLRRRNMSCLFGDDTVTENSLPPIENGNIETEASESEIKNEKRPVWLKQKRGGSKKPKKQPNKPKPIAKAQKVEEEVALQVVEKKPKENEEESHSEESESSVEEETDSENVVQKPTNDEDDQEWEKLKQLTDREKSLEGKSKTSHSVHCPYFPMDKQEYWWTYISDRKSKTLLTMPHFVTNLVHEQVVHLKFTAPKWPNVYTFTACLRSDSYIGFDQQREIKLDVKEAPKIPEQHPQWEFEDSDDGKEDKAENNESDYTTDEDYAEDD